MATLPNLSRQSPQSRELNFSLQKEEEMRRVKTELDGVIFSTFSQLRNTFASLERALQNPQEKTASEEDVPIPKFGKIDDQKSTCSQRRSEIALELDDVQNQLRLDILELGIQADKQRIMQKEELRKLEEKKNSLEQQQKVLACEYKSKERVLAEKVKVAEAQLKMKREQQALIDFHNDNLEEYARFKEEQIRIQKLKQFIYKIEDECREELKIRLALAYIQGRDIDYDAEEMDAVVAHMVRQRISHMLKQED